MAGSDDAETIVTYLLMYERVKLRCFCPVFLAKFSPVPKSIQIFPVVIKQVKDLVDFTVLVLARTFTLLRHLPFSNFGTGTGVVHK
jgi:hypothetical protein